MNVEIDQPLHEVNAMIVTSVQETDLPMDVHREFRQIRALAFC